MFGNPIVLKSKSKKQEQKLELELSTLEESYKEIKEILKKFGIKYKEGEEGEKGEESDEDEEGETETFVGYTATGDLVK